MKRWSCQGGYREILHIALPLILSTSALSVQQFVDRMLLSWYSSEALAASVPSGILSFTISCLFIGTASYVNTFVAQYYGAENNRQIGRAVWQGIYFSFIAMIVMILCVPFAELIFRAADHTPAIQRLERSYFVILCYGGLFPVLSAAISSFFSGIGKTSVVMWVSFAATGVNIVLDYCLIFGNFGFPELGIEGAAYATVLSGIVSCAFLFAILLKKKYRVTYHTWSGRGVDIEMFKRLIKFGFPNGVQFFLDMLGFTLFILLVGRYGKVELAATNIAFNINSLAFLPMIGMGIAVSVVVGQRLGENEPEKAEYSVWSALHLGMIYMTLISICYLAFPGLFLRPFGYGDEESFEAIYEYGVVLLRFVALYSVFDSLIIVFSSAIKGAGDTKFVMWAIVLLSWSLMVIPTYLAVSVFKWTLFSAWGFATNYILILGVVFYLRFRGGAWKTMRVIEERRVPTV